MIRQRYPQPQRHFILHGVTDLIQEKAIFFNGISGLNHAPFFAAQRNVYRMYSKVFFNTNDIASLAFVLPGINFFDFTPCACNR
jgi:hypothetical protein